MGFIIGKKSMIFKFWQKNIYWCHQKKTALQKPVGLKEIGCNSALRSAEAA
ncbi:MAG: hypothetical protein ACYCZ6_10180 [Polaromonas sp.]